MSTNNYFKIYGSDVHDFVFFNDQDASSRDHALMEARRIKFEHDSKRPKDNDGRVKGAAYISSWRPTAGADHIGEAR